MVIFYVFLIVLVTISLITGLIITIVEKRSISVDEYKPDIQQENIEEKVVEEKVDEEIEILDLDDEIVDNNIENLVSDSDEIDII